MIQVLVIANESVLAEYIALTLSDETDLDVVRVTQAEADDVGRYPVVIIVEDDDAAAGSFPLADIEPEKKTVLAIKVSLKDKNIHVVESYQLSNPKIERLVDLVRDFRRRNPEIRSSTAAAQKKMNETRNIRAGKYSLQHVFFQAEDFVAYSNVRAILRPRDHVTLPITTQIIKMCDAIQPQRIEKVHMT